MKYQFILFFSVVLLIHGSVNYYIALRGYQAIELYPMLRPYFVALMIFLSVAFFAGRILENCCYTYFTDALIWIGSFWFAAMLYFFLFILIADILRLLDGWFSFLPGWLAPCSPRTKFILFLAAVTFIAAILAAGYFNARHPRIRQLEIGIPKNKGGAPLTIAIMSDIHLGTIIGNARFEKMVQQVNTFQPDIILLPGDILDEDLKPVLRQDTGAWLLKLQSRLGVYGVTGNHEYIGGVNPACDYLEHHRIRMLRDTVVLVDNRFYLAGREDRSSRSFAGIQRKPLADILHGIDRSYPLLLMDHQPLELDEAIEAGADLQVSGHTHNGQLWPLNYITDLIYEISHGYLNKNGTHIYVSCGIGTWGPPVRIGNRPEIVLIRLVFTGN